MKILTIPDVHSKDCVISKIKNEIDNYNKIVVLGDYGDPYKEVPREKTISTLLELIELKKEYPNKIKLLLGNHDIHYIFLHTILENQLICSRFDDSIAQQLQKIFIDNIKLFDVAYQYKNYLWTHAGISSYMFHVFNFKDIKTIAKQLTKFYKEEDKRLFYIGTARGGNDSEGSIFWADIMETINSIPDNLHQIVGHSKVKIINTCYGTNNNSITYCDCLEYIENYYKLKI